MLRYGLLVLAVSLVAISATVDAQQAGGSAIQGRVVDEQKGVLPGVTIVVTHQESGTHRETITSAEGTYFVIGLIPGTYRVTADLEGFKKLTRENIRLQIGATQTLDLQLEVGTLEESLTVTAAAPVVDVTSTQVGGHVASGELTELPSPSRNFIGFVAMLPGVQANPHPEGSDSININSQPTAQVNFVLDGANNTDDHSASASGGQTRTPLEAVQEFQVVTNQIDVEYGRTTGGVVNAVTKQGTNRFRGSTFGYLTNSAMTATNFFERQAGDTVDEAETSKRQYGGTIGGPIVRNKAHFFVSFERYVLGTGITNVFPTRPDLNLSVTQGTNGRNLMSRVDHQINNANTYSFTFLTERQPNRNLYSGDRATSTTANYELDIDETIGFTYNRVIGSNMLNTVRASMVKEDINRGAEPGTFLETARKDLEDPVLRHLSFDQQGHTNGHHRTNTAWGIDNTFSWYVAEKGGDHALKFGLQYLYVQNVLEEQGTMNGVFTFASDLNFDPANPSTYPERLALRVPGPQADRAHTHSIGWFAQDKWQVRPGLTLSLGLRWDVDIAPIRLDFNPLFSDPAAYPVDKNNFQPRAGFAYDLDGRSVLRGGIGRYYEKLFVGQVTPSIRQGVWVDSVILNFPTNSADSGPGRGQLPTDPMLANGPVINRDRLNQLYPPGAVIRNTSAVQLDTPDRQLPTSTQISAGYERQLSQTVSVAADYVRNRGRGWLSYNVNPGLRVDTSRTGAIIRTDLLGLAQQLGLPPFQNNVFLRFDYSGVTEYDGLNLQMQRRHSGFWGGRVSYTIGHARGNHGGQALGTNNLQVLENRNLDLNWGPLDTDRRHNLVVSGRMQVPYTKGVTVSALYRYMSGRPFTIINSNVDADRNGILFDPVPAGSYSGNGPNALTVENKGGRNGAYGPAYAQLDARLGYRVQLPGDQRTFDLFVEVFNVTDRSNFTNPNGDQRLPTFLIPTGLVGGGFPRQLQIGVRLGF